MHEVLRWDARGRIGALTGGGREREKALPGSTKKGHVGTNKLGSLHAEWQILTRPDCQYLDLGLPSTQVRER